MQDHSWPVLLAKPIQHGMYTAREICTDAGLMVHSITLNNCIGNHAQKCLQEENPVHVVEYIDDQGNICAVSEYCEWTQSEKMDSLPCVEALSLLGKSNGPVNDPGLQELQGIVTDIMNQYLSPDLSKKNAKIRAQIRDHLKKEWQQGLVKDSKEVSETEPVCEKEAQPTSQYDEVKLPMLLTMEYYYGKYETRNTVRELWMFQDLERYDARTGRDLCQHIDKCVRVENPWHILEISDDTGLPVATMIVCEQTDNDEIHVQCVEFQDRNGQQVTDPDLLNLQNKLLYKIQKGATLELRESGRNARREIQERISRPAEIAITSGLQDIKRNTGSWWSKPYREALAVRG